MKKKPKPATGMTAADCARRTGLTVRALRVYERAGLLKPASGRVRLRGRPLAQWPVAEIPVRPRASPRSSP